MTRKVAVIAALVVGIGAAVGGGIALAASEVSSSLGDALRIDRSMGE